ncbi:SctK family type III secretion system sorting platform protein VscK [Vibrio europaeus]|uniref:SctK family type III secretion system sorting platform protein VscK n=1 Tax=Vibrio europaeus TaxID=300876 RepID=UPI00234029D4|nr:SctK family type III secretion system sorting platform protein VscK [Vibrio europaeus]MDC5840580.1 SctK family type III secretion system sorting platform protein VscK [Vibrio europaeus]
MANPETSLSQVVHQFNYCPCQYMDSSWLTDKQPWIENLDGWRHRPVLNNWVLKEWALTPISESTFNIPTNSVALLPPEPLRKLLVMVGGVLHCISMRQVILKEPKQHLHTAFGSEGMQFCIQQGPMLLSDWPEGWQHKLPSQFDSVSLQERALQLGFIWFGFILKNSPGNFQQRWRFKIKQSDFVFSSNAAWLEESQRDLAYRLTKKIAKQVIPQWFHLLK